MAGKVYGRCTIKLINSCVKSGKVCKTDSGKCVLKNPVRPAKGYTLLNGLNILIKDEDITRDIIQENKEALESGGIIDVPQLESRPKPREKRVECGRTVWENNCCNPETQPCRPDEVCSASSGKCITKGTYTRTEFKRNNPSEIVIGGRTIVGPEETINRLREIFGSESSPPQREKTPPPRRPSPPPRKEKTPPPRRPSPPPQREILPPTREEQDIDSQINEITNTLDTLKLKVPEKDFLIQDLENSLNEVTTEEEKDELELSIAEATTEKDDMEEEIKTLISQLEKLALKKLSQEQQKGKAEKDERRKRLEVARARLEQRKAERLKQEKENEKEKERLAREQGEILKQEQKEQEREQKREEKEQKEAIKLKEAQGKEFIESIQPQQVIQPQLIPEQQRLVPREQQSEEVVIESVAEEPYSEAIEGTRQKLRDEFVECLNKMSIES